MKQEIILISGKKRAGKNFFGDILKEYYESKGKKVLVTSYGDAVKEIVSRSFGISREQLEDFKNNKIEIYVKDSKFENPKTSIFFEKLLNFREFLQKFATEGMRSCLGENIWVDTLLYRIKNNDADVIIITDWRFIAEDLNLRGFKAKKIRILGMFDSEADNHRSETELDNYNFDIVIDNSKHPEKEILLKKFLENS